MSTMKQDAQIKTLQRELELLKQRIEALENKKPTDKGKKWLN